MKDFENPVTHLLVLAKGESLMLTLETFAASKEIKSAWMNGIGASSSLTMGVYRADNKDYAWKDFNQQLEILSLEGNLSWVDGKPFWHIHGTFSDEDYRCFGGHVKDLVIGVTGELLITPIATSFTRTFDEETGIKLLEIAQ